MLEFFNMADAFLFKIIIFVLLLAIFIVMAAGICIGLYILFKSVFETIGDRMHQKKNHKRK